MKSYKKAALASALVFVLAACGNEKAETTPTMPASAPETQTTTAIPVAEVAPKEMTIKHESGETKVKLNPQRVAAFDFGSLDTLEALGVDVIGIPKANIPAYLAKYKEEKYTDFGGLKEPDFEKLHGAKPDFIVVSGRQASLYDQFSEIAPTINFNIDYAQYIPSLEEHVLVLGRLFGKEEIAKAQLAELNQQIADVRAKTENMPEKALILLANDGKISAYGSGSRFAFIHDVLNFKTADEKITVSTHGQNVSFEYVMDLNPDYIYVIDRSAVVGNSETSAKQLIENDLVKNTNAFKNGKIIYLDPNVWYLSGGGLKSTKVMVEDIQKSLEQ